MAGIYIHIPFCKQKCHYCDFHFSVSMKNKGEILSSLKKEFSLRKSFFKSQNDPIETIYFGGGTPSLLTGDELNYLIEELAANYDLSALKEITIECNPDDLSKDKIRELAGTSINRLSIGIQSFRNVDLIEMNRAHNSTEAVQCVKWAQDKGFDNITIDLIYGLPNLTLNDWISNLDMAANLQVQHLSCYSLTIEKKTALHHFIEKGLIKPADEETTILHFEYLLKWAEQQELDHYEISNFAKPGFLAQHNTNYWKDKSYIGFGPSAHSYNGESRSWNIASNTKYIKSINSDIIPSLEEKLTKKDKYNEYMLTGLRTKWGIEHTRLESYGNESKIFFEKNIKSYVDSGHVLELDNGWSLSKSGKLIADRISSDLFEV